MRMRMRVYPWMAIVGVFLLVNFGGRLGGAESGLVTLSNGVIAISFDKESGALVSVANRAAGLSLLPEDGEKRLPFVIDTGSKNPPEVEKFFCGANQDESGNRSMLLTWECSGDIIVRVAGRLANGSPMVLLTPEVINGGAATIKRFAFPVLGKLAPLGDSAENDILAHGFSRGLIVRNPAKTLDVQNNPLKSAQYPQSYSGMSHQLVDYYSEGVGGFFFAAFDPYATEKLVQMPLDDGSLTMQWVSTNWNQTPGAGMDFGFPFVIGANTSGDWREAADIYREWALTTDWCKSGPNYLKGEDEKCRWLLEETGLTTFGVSSREDKSDVFQGYHDLIGAPIFQITGHDFREYPMGASTRDVFEPFVHPNNIETFKRNGDRWAPFFFDQKSAFLSRELQERFCKTPLQEKWHKNQMCPTLAYWKSLHADRDVFIQSALGCDASYYDASAPNRSLHCFNTDHPHPPGAGRWMNEGFRELYKNTRRALREAAGRYIPIGVELMHEGLIDSYDYYQARSSGGFMGLLESGYYRGEKISGMVEAAPIFGYIYHDYAPVAMDGCGKVSEKIGDIFYWMAARTLLWGELFQLNCEYSPAERFPGMTKVGQIHFHRPYDWLDVDHPVNTPVDPKKGEFLREMHAARTGFAKDFLVYGRMLPPLDFDCGKVPLDYCYYQNLDWGGKPNSLQYADQKGTWDAPRVLHAAWKFEDRLGLLFVNLGEKEHAVKIDLDLSKYEKYGLTFGSDIEVKRYGTNGTYETDGTNGDCLELSLPSRKIVLVEIAGEPRKDEAQARHATTPPTIKVAAVRVTWNKHKEPAAETVARGLAMAEEAAEMGAKYIVLPENFLCSDNPAEQQVPGPLVEQVEAIAKKHNVYICVGMVESAVPYWRKGEWDKYLSAILVGPEGYISTHRKVDIVISPMAQAWKESHPKTDAHAWAGEDFRMHSAGEIDRLAIMICRDGNSNWAWTRVLSQDAQILFYPNLRSSIMKYGANLPAMAKRYGLPIVAADGHIESESLIIDRDGTIVDIETKEQRVLYGEVTLADEHPEYTPFEVISNKP